MINENKFSPQMVWNSNDALNSISEYIEVLQNRVEELESEVRSLKFELEYNT